MEMVHSTLLNGGAIFTRFNLHPVYGFLSHESTDNVRLPGDFLQWDYIAANLPALSATGQLNAIVQNVRQDKVDYF